MDSGILAHRARRMHEVRVPAHLDSEGPGGLMLNSNLLELEVHADTGSIAYCNLSLHYGAQ